MKLKLFLLFAVGKNKNNSHTRKSKCIHLTFFTFRKDNIENIFGGL